jgi:hypothetical protein
MKQSVIVQNDTGAEASAEQIDRALKSERRALDQEWRRLEAEKKLVDTKLKILEDEFKKLSEEKKYVERQKKYYEYVIEHEEQTAPAKQIASGEMFFVGVASEKTLKKRYKQLVKIYHPDNLDGDGDAIQEINREYDRLISSLKK